MTYRWDALWTRLFA
ncbi:hypothetical protein LEMLEM_LOCUS16803 [Lemmus lemmus]